jgi:hypothetical protein
MVVDIRGNETVLFFWCWICTRVACPGPFGIVIVVAPFGEMICEFQGWYIGCRVFKVYYNELFVGISRE